MVEWGCIGFLLGAIVCIVFFGMGVCCGRCNNEQSDDDSDVQLYVLNRYRTRSRDNRHDIPKQEIVDVLYMLRIAASSREKRVIDYLIDKEEEHEQNNING